MTFMQKLTRDRGKFMRISMDAKDYIRGNEVRSVKWNGREIRNGEFKTLATPLERTMTTKEENLTRSTSLPNRRVSCRIRG